MPDINVFAIPVAAILAIVLGSTYYVVFAAKWAQLSDAGAWESRPKPWKLAVELLRGLILAAVVAGLASHGKISDARGGLLLGAALWIGFRFVLWTGAMMWVAAARLMMLPRWRGAPGPPAPRGTEAAAASPCLGS